MEGGDYAFAPGQADSTRLLHALAALTAMVQVGPLRTQLIVCATYADAVAFGEYVDSSLTVSNMGQLRINTSSKFSDEHQLFAAGFLEAYLSAERIHDYFSNTYEYFTSPTGMNASQSLGEALRWLEDQEPLGQGPGLATVLVGSRWPKYCFYAPVHGSTASWH